VDPQRHLSSATMTFRLFLFADRGANRVTRPEQISGEARRERLSCSSLEVPGSELRLPLPGGSPRHQLCSLRLRGKSSWIAVPGKTLSHSSDFAEKINLTAMFFTDFRQGAKLAPNQKDVRRLARFRALGSTANQGVQPVRLKRATYALRTLTEFHRSREFIAAARASALALRFHGSDRPSEAIKASQRAWISSSICSCVAWKSGAWL